jgi:glycerate kinase
MKVVVALDSFKGSLRASVACSAVKRGILDVLPEADVRAMPMADGGEGTADAVLAATGGRWIPCDATGPLPDKRVKAGYASLPAPAAWREWSGAAAADGPSALVEMASASGLELLPAADRNPLRTTTFGTGELIGAATTAGASRIWLAIGGSATVDGGTGAASALGWKFLDKRGEPIGLGGGTLAKLDHIAPPPAHRSKLPPLAVLCDVDNPLLGPQGAARVFGPQKGADAGMVEALEAGLARLADVIERDLGRDVRELRGAGAAGGFGAGAVAFFAAVLRPGVQAVMEAIDLERALQGADWIVTGEGRFDEQSLQGKVFSGVSGLARRAGVPLAVICGSSPFAPAAAPALGIAELELASPWGRSFDEIVDEAEALLAAAARRFAAKCLGDRSSGKADEQEF